MNTRLKDLQNIAHDYCISTLIFFHHGYNGFRSKSINELQHDIDMFEEIRKQKTKKRVRFSCTTQ